MLVRSELCAVPYLSQYGKFYHLYMWIYAREPQQKIITVRSLSVGEIRLCAIRFNQEVRSCQMWCSYWTNCSCYRRSFERGTKRKYFGKYLVVTSYETQGSPKRFWRITSTHEEWCKLHDTEWEQGEGARIHCLWAGKRDLAMLAMKRWVHSQRKDALTRKSQKLLPAPYARIWPQAFDCILQRVQNCLEASSMTDSIFKRRSMRDIYRIRGTEKIGMR